MCAASMGAGPRSPYPVPPYTDEVPYSGSWRLGSWYDGSSYSASRLCWASARPIPRWKAAIRPGSCPATVSLS
ncbi:hypothetical protein QR97_14790 [Streptomyces sp. PBH53]|nr:hypothetical protein QR97_14790 [Streptomyces sp. PBH53]